MSLFSLFIALSAAIGLAWIVFDPGPVEHKSKMLDPLAVVDQAVVVLVLALVGGRLGYTVAHTSYFSTHPLEIPQIWLGGLSGGGALLGALSGVMVSAVMAKTSALALADRLVRLGALLAAAAWLGCWRSGSAYGLLADGWWGMPALDEWGNIERRLPIQLMGALFALVWMAFLDWQAGKTRSWTDGLRSGAWLAGMGAVMTILSQGRGDPAAVLSGLRADTWGGLGAAGAGLLWFMVSLAARKLRHPDSNE